MSYLCVKPFSAGGVAYHSGEIIPNGVILPERSGKLMKSGYISERNMKVPQESVAELQETEPRAYEGTVLISVKSASGRENEQAMVIPAKPEEIQQVFSIQQMNAEEGAKVITEVTNENVLILLHAADSRKTIKNAVKDQADKLFSTGEDSNESSKGDTTTDTNTEGVDT